jgi:hypothetical protein
VTEREVVDALYSPQRIEDRIGSLLLAVAGLADSARVIVVLCERIGKVNGYAILAAIPATLRRSSCGWRVRDGRFP